MNVRCVIVCCDSYRAHVGRDAVRVDARGEEIVRVGDRDERAAETDSDGVFANVRYAGQKKKAPGKGGNRYYKNIGLGFKTPREAIEGTYDGTRDSSMTGFGRFRAWTRRRETAEERRGHRVGAFWEDGECGSVINILTVTFFHFAGTYIDKKCPFTGNVSIRGRILTGVVKSTKMNRTIVMRMDYLHFIKKYQRYEKRHTNISAHISPCFRCNEGDKVVVGQCRPLSKTVRFNTLKVIPSGSKAGKAFVAH